jgi:LAGLIDADG DNA endonuclease family
MTEPKVYTRPLDKRTGGIYTKVSFKTCAFPCFTELYNIFYFEGKKIPLNIVELLTPVGLAYWLCDDGGKSGNGFHFATNGFTAEDVRLLVSVLQDKFGLKCSIQSRNRIYVWASFFF